MVLLTQSWWAVRATSQCCKLTPAETNLCDTCVQRGLTQRESMRHTWAFDNETMMCDVLLYTSHGYKRGMACTVTDLI